MNMMTQQIERPAALEAGELSSRAMLVTFQVSQWTARRIDRKVTREVNEAHNAKQHAGRYNKCLIDPKALLPVTQAAAEARAEFNRLSLPWTSDGTRILPVAAFDTFQSKMRKCRETFEAKVAEFIAAYPDHIETARVELGEMFNEGEYPSQSGLHRRFRWRISVGQITDNRDWRVALSEEKLDAIREQVEAEMSETMDRAVADCFKRLSDVVGRMAERLRAYKPATASTKAEGIFRDSLVENVRDVVAVLPMLNITGDAKLAAVIEKARESLCVADAQRLRDDPIIRADVAAEAEAIMADMADFMGEDDD